MVVQKRIEKPNQKGRQKRIQKRMQKGRQKRIGVKSKKVVKTDTYYVKQIT